VIKGRITPERRAKWDRQIHFLCEHSGYLNDWETGFVDSIELRRSEGKDLSIQQSFKLNEIFHRVEQKVG